MMSPFALRCLSALWVSAAVLPLFLLSTAAEGRTKGTVWVDMPGAPATIDFEEFKEALKLRLPDRTVRRKPATGPSCPTRLPDDAAIRLQPDETGALVVEVHSCADSVLLLRDTVQTNADATEAVRRAAVSAAVALDAPPSEASREVSPSSVSAAVTKRRRVMGFIALSPAATITFGGDAAFTGHLDAGPLFRNGISIDAGADVSTRIRGLAVKKNETLEEGTEAGVTDFGFRLGIFYRFELRGAWYLETGAGVRYVISRLEDMTSHKFAIEETNPAARGSAFIALAAALQLTRFFALRLEGTPAVSFGQRQYTARGEEALNFGWGSATVSLGAVFYL